MGGNSESKRSEQIYEDIKELHDLLIHVLWGGGGEGSIKDNLQVSVLSNNKW